MLHICLFGRSNIILFDDIYWNPYPCKKLPLNVSCNMFYSYQWHNDPYHEWHFMHLIWTVAQISEEWNCSWLWIIGICNAFPILNVSHITSSYYIQFTCSWILCVCVCVSWAMSLVLTFTLLWTFIWAKVAYVIGLPAV